jgi:hypothetical protein
MAKSKEESPKTLHYAERYDIPRATISEIREQILLTWKAKQHRGAICVVGEAGIGKSQVVAQIARDEGAHIYDIRTAHYGLVGTGIPSTKHSPEGYFDLLVPSVFPKQGEKSIMLFEEINQGLQHSIAMFFSLVEDRRMFNYFLPEEAIVVALMNPATAQYMVTQIENNAALRRRLKWFYAIDSFKDWVNHAKSPHFHESDSHLFENPTPCYPGVLDFIQKYPNNLYDRKAQKEGKQYMCPATIQTISLDAYVLEKSGYPVDGDFAKCRYAASVGEAMAKQLIEHLRDNRTAVNTEDVLLNYKKKAQRAIQLLLEKSSHEKLIELNGNVLTYLFGMQPAVDKVADNLVSFLSDLPNEMCTALFSQLSKYASDNRADEYLFALMRRLQTNPGWSSLNEKLDTAQNAVETAIADNV